MRATVPATRFTLFVLLTAGLCLAAPLALNAASLFGSGQDASEQALAALERSNAQLRRFVLDNGMVCLVKEDRTAPVVSIQIWVGIGSAQEDDCLGAGLSHYVEHMIFKGTPARTPGAISKEISDAGGTINAYTGRDRTVFLTNLPSESWETGLLVLADATLNASFPEEEWKREKQVILREFAMGNDDPDRVLSKLLWRTAYRIHPYRVPIIGYEDVFTTMTRENLVRFFRRHYTPDNMLAVVVGDIDADQIEYALREVFGKVPRGMRAPVVLPAEPPQLAERFARESGAYNVSRLHLAYHTTALSDPDTPALDVLAAVAGQGRSSQLVQRIKEEKKLAHAIGAWSMTPKEPGLFVISATYDPEKEEALLAAVRAEVESWSGKGFAQSEIEKARRTVLTGELAQLETMHGQADSYAAGEFYAGDPRFAEAYVRALHAVTPDSLRAVAQKYLRPENRTLVILSPQALAPPAEIPAAVVLTSDTRKTTLPNGIRLLVREDHKLPFVSLCAVLGGGLLSENAHNNGITQLMASLLTRGTQRRSALEIAQTTESLGGSLSPFSGRNSFGLQAKCLSADLNTFMDLLADCLASPTFPAAEVQKQRQVQIAEIKAQRERPFFLAEEALKRALFPGHPYRWNVAGSEETAGTLQPRDMLEHYRKLVAGPNMILAVFGDVAPLKAEKMAEKYFGALPRGESTPAAFAWLQPQAARKPTGVRELPARKETTVPKEQAILLAAYPACAITDPLCDATQLLERSLSGLSSDLAVKVREKEGLVYYIGAFQLLGVDPGMFGVYAGTTREGLAQVETLVNQEFKRLAAEGLRQEELDRAKKQIMSEHKMKLQSNQDTALECALNELYGLGYQHTFTLAERISALKPDDVRAAAAAMLNPQRQAVSIVMPQQPPADPAAP
ncbi:MAG: insulinase family protein [Kiritimatiellae bacterium]|nr:insulinase family protein [Kiritimatiellia bacterium]